MEEVKEEGLGSEDKHQIDVTNALVMKLFFVAKCLKDCITMVDLHWEGSINAVT